MTKNCDHDNIRARFSQTRERIKGNRTNLFLIISIKN